MEEGEGVASMPGRRAKGEEHKLDVAADLLDVRGDEQGPDLAAYAFAPGGALIDRVPLKAGKATLSIPARDEAQSVRVVVGPLIEPAEGAPLGELLRRRASELFVRIDPGALETKVGFELARPDWLCWLIGRCVVRGTLLKRVSSGGMPIDLPVCGAEVEIYEVDPIPVLIPRIPVELLERLRTIVRFPPPPPPPPPPPDDPFGPRPGPDPSPIDELITESRLALVRSHRRRRPAPSWETS